LALGRLGRNKGITLSFLYFFELTEVARRDVAFDSLDGELGPQVGCVEGKMMEARWASATFDQPSPVLPPTGTFMISYVLHAFLF